MAWLPARLDLTTLHQVARERGRPTRGDRRIAGLLLAAGAPVGGSLGERETPLVNAASYGDADARPGPRPERPRGWGKGQARSRSQERWVER